MPQVTYSKGEIKSRIGFFDIRDYGARTSLSDNGPAINAAIAAAVAVGGGIVKVPNGIWDVASPLVTTGVNPNSQLVIPAIDIGDSDTQVPLTIQGVEPVCTATGAGSDFTVVRGSVIRSTLSGVATTYGSVLGGKGSGASALPGFTNVQLYLFGLTFIVKWNTGTYTGPLVHGINLQNIAGVTVENCRVDVDIPPADTTDPTDQYITGVILPQNGNGAWNSAYNSEVQCFPIGYNVGEHAEGHNLIAKTCRKGFYFPFAYHSSAFKRLGAYWCKYPVSFNNGVGPAYTTISELDCELIGDPSKWYDTDKIIEDPDDYGHGRISYHLVTSGVGVTNNSFSKTGGDNLSISTLTPAESQTFTTPTLLNSWANYGGGNSDVGYIKRLDGFVRLMGTLNGGAATNVTIFQLPVGYRPAGYTRMPIMTNAGIGSIRIDPSGDVVVETGGITAWVTLDGVEFWPA